MRTAHLALIAIAMLVGVSVVVAEEPGYRIHTKAGKFEDVRDDLKDAIINRGFVIDYVGHLGAMLERTAEAAGGATAGASLRYRNAEYVQFCPSKLTHEAVGASPFAIANCPVSIFIYEALVEPGKIVVGFRLPAATPSDALREINRKFTSLLDEIAVEATRK